MPLYKQLLLRKLLKLRPCARPFLHTHRFRTNLFNLNLYEYAALDVAEYQTPASQSTAGTSLTALDIGQSTSVHRNNTRACTFHA